MSKTYKIEGRKIHDHRTRPGMVVEGEPTYRAAMDWANEMVKEYPSVCIYGVDGNGAHSVEFDTRADFKGTGGQGL